MRKRLRDNNNDAQQQTKKARILPSVSLRVVLERDDVEKFAELIERVNERPSTWHRLLPTLTSSETTVWEQVIEHGSVRCLWWLLEHVTLPRSMFEATLSKALALEDYQCTSRLLTYGLPLTRAALSHVTGRNVAIMELLDQAHQHETLNWRKMLPDDALHQFAERGCLDGVDFLLQRPSQFPVDLVSTTTRDRDTALHCCARAGHPTIVALLLRFSCQVNLLNNRKQTALSCALESWDHHQQAQLKPTQGLEQCVAQLLLAGANDILGCVILSSNHLRAQHPLVRAFWTARQSVVINVLPNVLAVIVIDYEMVPLDDVVGNVAN